MLSPLVYVKVVCAKKAYCKAGRKDVPAAKSRLLDIAGDRYCFYRQDGRPRDAARILELATTKENATNKEKIRLRKLREDMRCPDEPSA